MFQRLIGTKDFSDRLTRRRKAMYRTFVKRPTLETSEYELIPKELALQETPLQKLRRLQYELQELSEEVEKKKVCWRSWKLRLHDRLETESVLNFCFEL